MISIYDVLKASKGINVDDTFAELWGRKLSNAYTVATYTGTLPATLQTVAGYLESYKIYGNTVQNGTPTPETPVMPIGCGELETTGAHAGQYKLPILSNSAVTDIYLGEVPTTRRIKKLVLTGEETISSATESTLEPGAYCFACLYSDLGMTDIVDFDLDMRGIPYPRYVSDHFQMRATPTQQIVEYHELYAGEMGANSRKGSWTSNRTFNRYIIFCVSGISTVAGFKAYLQQQYANGTPVTIWYILEKPEIGIVNEPLMKIGDYADTIDSSQSTVQIPTVAGTTVIDYNDEPKPEKVELTYKKTKGQ